MRRKRAGIGIAFLILAAIACEVAPNEAVPDTVKEIVPGVWFRAGDRDQGHCNNVIIEMADYLIVVDANFPSGARAVMEDLAAVSSKPVKYVFDTHHHGDHAYGNVVWTRQGATTLAYTGVAEEMKRYEPARWQGAAKTRKDLAELNLPGPEPPQEIFSNSPHIIDDGERRVELHFFGWAHTRGDSFAYLPKEKVLCTGDAIVNGPFNYTGDANIGNWPNVASQAEQLDVIHVLPGHGAPGGKELISGQKQFFIELHKVAAAAVKDGIGLDDLKSLKLPDSVSNWVGPSLEAQMKVAYEEIRQGIPHGEILGGK